MDNFMKKWLQTNQNSDKNQNNSTLLISSDELEEEEEISNLTAANINENESKTVKNKKCVNFGKFSRSTWISDPLFKNWILFEDDEKIKCKFCNVLIFPKKSTLVQHMNTKKHKVFQNVTKLHKSNALQKFRKIKDETYVNELRAALFISMHTSIISADHLISCQKSSTKSDVIKNMRLNRTKCTYVINEVIFPYFTKQLRSDIGNGPYSLIIDESNDITSIKLLGIVIKYYSTKMFLPVTCFLALVELELFDAENIANKVKQTLANFSLPLNQLKGLGTDNASVMVGINNGVHKKLLNDSPNLILVPCVCHSLQLAVSAASKRTLPSDIEFLIGETFNWFSHSAVRQNNYKRIYSAMNDGHEPYKIIKACDTRWMSIYSAVKRVLQQWEELKLHFNLARTAENCFKAQTLFKLYNETNFLYLTFLEYILGHVNKVNLLFECNNADISKILNDMEYLLRFLTFKIYRDDIPDFDPFESSLEETFLLPTPYFGYKTEEILGKFSNEEATKIRQTCKQFIFQLVKEFRNRLPKNIKILKKMDIFSPRQIFEKTTQEKLEKLIDVYDKEEKIQIINEYNNLKLVEWQDSTNCFDFWSQVFQYKDAVNFNPFSKIANFAISFLTLPFSNAEVERVFSYMNIIKTKLRNRMKCKLLNSLLMIRTWCKARNQCCHSVHISDELLNNYKNKKYNEQHNEVEEDVTDEDFSLENYIDVI